MPHWHASTGRAALDKLLLAFRHAILYNSHMLTIHKLDNPTVGQPATCQCGKKFCAVTLDKWLDHIRSDGADIRVAVPGR